jgi:hypothetical protein
MNTFRKHMLALGAVAALASCSQFDSKVPLKDLGFEIGSEIAWNAEYMAYTLRLSLAEGEDGDYLFTYLVDGDPLVKLSSTGGGTVESGQELAMSAKATLICLLPSLAPDKEHALDMEFSREGVSRSYTLKLPDTSQNGIGIRMDTDANLDFSRVILTNRMGPSVTTYDVTFYLDGELLTGIKYMSNTFDGSMAVDFARSESYTFEMPYLVAGEHVLKVDVRSSLGSESTRLSFTEPQRRQTALAFSYNDFTGRLMLESAYNPLDTAFDITVDITVKGSITARHPLFFGIADPETETFTVTGEATARVTPGINPEQVDGGKLKSLMDEIYANTREDAANAIGNGNRRTLHADVTSVTLSISVHSLGVYAGKTVVTISPSSGSGLPVRYTYAEQTWLRSRGAVQTVYPSLTVNGASPSAVSVL